MPLVNQHTTYIGAYAMNKKVCSESDCTRDLYLRGYCCMHYRRYMKSGKLKRVGRPSHLSLEEIGEWLLENRVTRHNDCLIFNGTKTNGYGKVDYKRRDLAVHRVVAYARGIIHDIDSSSHVLHSAEHCERLPDNLGKSCINPDHLRAGTHYENMQDRHLTDRYANKLTKEKVYTIRGLLKHTNITQRKVARHFGINVSNVSRIKSGDRWRID